MAFTPEEQAVLCELSYRDIKTSPQDPVSLYEVLTDPKMNLDGALGDGYKGTLKGLREKVKDKDYHIVRSVDNDDTSGFVALAISDPDNNVTVVCRGSEDLSQIKTNQDSQKDFDTDAQLVTKHEADQHKDMENFVRYLEEQGYDGFYFTGHSLGGNLAIHGALHVRDSKKVKSVTTFNSPGFNKVYRATHFINIQRLKDKISNYENRHDYVSDINIKPGTTYYIESDVPGEVISFIHHSLCNFKIENGGFVISKTKGTLSYVLDNLDLIKVVQVIFGTVGLLPLIDFIGSKVIDFFAAGGASLYRDFSQDALDTLLAAVQETEEEDWWQIDRWDCWYRLDKAFGGCLMNYQYLTGNVDNYYRKVIDINDASTTDIREIFRKVHEIDSSSAGKVNQAVSELNSSVLNKLITISNSVSPGI